MAVFLFDSELYINAKTRAEKYSITAGHWASFFIFIFPSFFILDFISHFLNKSKPNDKPPLPEKEEKMD